MNTRICFFPIKKQVLCRWIQASLFPSVHWTGRHQLLLQAPVAQRQQPEAGRALWQSIAARTPWAPPPASPTDCSGAQQEDLMDLSSHPPQMFLCDHPPAWSQQKHIKTGKVLRLANTNFCVIRSHLLEKGSISKLYSTVYFQVLISL